MNTAISRRHILLSLGVATACAVVCDVQAQPSMPVIGFLRSTTFGNADHLVTPFKRGLEEVGFADGRNVTIEYKSAEGHADRLPALATDLVKLPASVIVGNTPAARAAKSATSTIPIVFTTAGDPVRDGLVTSLNRPGGNVTGIVFFGDELGAKRLELLRELVPGVATIAMLQNPAGAGTAAERRDVQSAANAIGQQLVFLDVRNPKDIETAFATLPRSVGAMIVGTDPLLSTNRVLIATLAARHRLPAIHTLRDQAEAGGLISYGSSNTDAYRQAGVYVGRILKGEKPADLPVMRSTKFDLVINARTARLLGISIPATLLAIADEVIE